MGRALRGLRREPTAHSIDAWSDRIAAHTGIERGVIAQALSVYAGR